MRTAVRGQVRKAIEPVAPASPQPNGERRTLQSLLRRAQEQARVPTRHLYCLPCYVTTLLLSM